MVAASLRRRIAGLSRMIRHLGWLDGSLCALSRALALVSRNCVRIHKYHLVAQPVSQVRWLAPHRGLGFEIRQIAELDPVVRQFPRPDWAAPYRFKQGAVCLGAFTDKRLVGFLWLILGPYLEDEVRCQYVPLPPGRSSWDLDVHVEPEYRNGIVFMKLWDEANRFLIERDVRWSLSRISAFNQGSMRSHARMGARSIGAVTFLSIGSWQIALSTVAPHFHLSTRSSSIPTYALNPDRSTAA